MNNQNAEPQGAQEPQAPETTFSQEDVDKAIAEAKLQWKADLKSQLENAKSEGAKLAKMTAEERKNEEERIEREKFAKDKAEFEHRTLVEEVRGHLREKGIPAELAEMAAGADADAAKGYIKTLSETWSKAISEAVDKKLSESAGAPAAERQTSQPSGIEAAFYAINPKLKH